MNENTPEINFKEKQEKKGFLPWLQSRLGFGAGRGGMGSAANFGKIGAAKFGASSGIGGLLAGKGSLLAAAAIMAVGTGVYIANTGPAPSQNSAFNSSKTPEKYVPAIERNQDNRSSLDMFKDTNKDAGFSLDENAAKKAQGGKDGAAQTQEQPVQNPDPNQNPQAAGNNMAQDIMAKLQGQGGASLSSSLGGGNNNFSGMGGFSNKFGQGAVGPKVGSGFASMPKFDQRKNKLLAMKSASRPVISKNAKGGKGSYGRGSFNQANAIKDIQRSYSGTSADSTRSTQDKAWEGSTEGGTAGGSGAGMSGGAVGGSGIVSSPSLDNGSSSGGDGDGDGTDDGIPDTSGPANANQGLTDLCNAAWKLILLAGALAIIGGILVKIVIPPWVAIAGYVICALAIAAGVAAVAIGVKIAVEYDQVMMGTMYGLGGAVGIAAGIMAMTGGSIGSISPVAMAAMAAIMGLMMAMSSAPVGTGSDVEMANKYKDRSIGTTGDSSSRSTGGVNNRSSSKDGGTDPAINTGNRSSRRSSGGRRDGLR